MRFVVIAPPAPVVTWEEASDHLRLDGDTSMQTQVEAMISAAQGTLDGPNGWLGRAIGVQTIEARVDSFGCGSIALPFPPLIEVLSVRYVDGAGVTQTIPSDQYEMLGTSLVPLFGATWPTPRWQREAVRVRYRAGYDDASPGNDDDFEDRTLPAAIRAAILLMVGDLWRFRTTASDGVSTPGVVPMSTTVEALLQSLRVFR